VRQRACLLLGLGVLLGAWAPQLWADQAATSSSSDKLTDYRGKGEISIAIQPAQSTQQPVNMRIPMEQAFRRPGTFLVSVSLVGRQTFLAAGDTENSYNSGQGLIVEKRYKNLDKSSTNPLFAVWASMYDLGRKVQHASTRRVVGSESMLGYDCEIVELDSKELLENISLGGLVGGQRGSELRGGRSKVWVVREYGLPLRVELAVDQQKPVMTIAFTELRINSGITKDDLRLDAPNGTRKISVTADLADPEWETKMDTQLRELVAKAQEEPTGNKVGSGS
jgi:outer membrane lipoprotein-sorting protein